MASRFRHFEAKSLRKADFFCLEKSLSGNRCTSPFMYDGSDRMEVIAFANSPLEWTSAYSPWSALVGKVFSDYTTGHNPSQIYRSRTLRAAITYHLLKAFSSSWKEVTMEVGGVAEKLLIQTAHEQRFRDAGFVISN